MFLNQEQKNKSVQEIKDLWLSKIHTLSSFCLYEIYYQRNPYKIP
jgi:hypothetical protein